MSAQPRLAVCLTFDFDGPSVWILRGESAPGISRGEFGAVGVPRVLEALDRHRVPATFFVPGHTALVYPELVRAIHERGHELGHHGWIHEPPASLTPEEERAGFARAVEAIERTTGVRPAGYRAPGCSFSASTIDILVEHDIRYDASCSASDFLPYYLRRGDRWSTSGDFDLGVASSVVELPFSWMLDDYPLFEFDGQLGTQQTTPSTVREIWQGEFDFAYEHHLGGVFTLCMHPEVIGRGSRLSMLEGFIEYMAAKPGVDFVHAGTYVERWRANHPRPA